MTILAIDVREACRPVRTGKGQWTYGLVTELARGRQNLILLCDSDVPDAWKSLKNVSVKFFAKGFLWHLSAGLWLLRNRSKIIFIAPLSYIIPAFFGNWVQTVLIVHDLIAFRDEPHLAKAKRIERMLLGPAARRAMRICTISQSTKSDFLSRFPNILSTKIKTIYAGPDKMHPSPATPDGKTILCIGTLSPRKNQLRLLQAFASLPKNIIEKHQLILAGGRGWDDEKILSLVSTLPNVRWLGPVSDEMYDSLLSTATLLALPSLYEGFGMQVLDALARGVPVLTSNRGSLPEVCADAAEYVDPESVENISSGLLQLLTDPERLMELRKKGPEQASHFSWQKTADLLLQTL